MGERILFGLGGVREEADMGREKTGGGPQAAFLRQDTKLCPRCGQILFADMDVCYGCLYDFGRDRTSRQLPSLADGTPQSAREGQAASGVLALVAQTPRVDSIDDLDEPLVPGEDVVLSHPSRRHVARVASPVFVLVRTGDMDVTVGVPEEGLHIGRAPTNDVVLHSKAVSLEHAVLMPDEVGIVVCDLGSTNPPLFKGRPIEGSACVPFGRSFLLCGSCFEPRHG